MRGVCNFLEGLSAEENTIAFGDLSTPEIDWDELVAKNYNLASDPQIRSGPSRRMSEEMIDSVFSGFFLQWQHSPTYVPAIMKYNISGFDYVPIHDVILINSNEMIYSVDNLAPTGNSDHVLSKVSFLYQSQTTTKTLCRRQEIYVRQILITSGEA